MFYSVCLPAVLGGGNIKEKLEKVRLAGYGHYEFWGWTESEIEEYKEAQQQEGLAVAGMCTVFEPLNDPARHEAYVEGLRITAVAALKLGCKTIISQVGQEREGVSREEQHASIVEGLKLCVPVLKENDLTLVIEPLNTRIDHKGYYLWSLEEAYQIIEEVGDSHVKVLCDLYHQYIMEDLNLSEILRNLDKIGHFHMAGYPGRHEPMIDSEIDYPVILKTIKESGYTGGVGLEYMPVKDAFEGLKELKRLLP